MGISWLTFSPKQAGVKIRTEGNVNGFCIALLAVGADDVDIQIGQPNASGQRKIIESYRVAKSCVQAFHQVVGDDPIRVGGDHERNDLYVIVTKVIVGINIADFFFDRRPGKETLIISGQEFDFKIAGVEKFRGMTDIVGRDHAYARPWLGEELQEVFHSRRGYRRVE